MRPRIVNSLNSWFRTDLFEWLVPVPSVVYGLMMIIVMVIFVRRVGSVGRSKEAALTCAIWTMVGALVGARVFYLARNLDAFLVRPESLLDLSGGTASWGAYLGGAIAFALFLRRRARDEAGIFADTAASCIALGPFIGRWACYLNGDDFGVLSGVPWAVRYPMGSYPYLEHMQDGLLVEQTAYSLPVHPFQLYLSLNALLVFLLFTLLWKRQPDRGGRLLVLFWIVYPATRFAWEFLRGGVPHDLLGVFSFSQVIAASIAVATAALLVGFGRGARRAVQTGSPDPYAPA